MARPAVFISILVLLFLALLELGSFLIVSQGNILGLKIIPNVKKYVEDTSYGWKQEYFSSRFDADLGWSYKKNTSREFQDWSYTIDEFKARANPNHEPTLAPLVAAFGDSFTFGDEVNDDETWEYFLSPLLGGYVANYGVGGYGTDQAVLRFERMLDQGLKPEIAILGIQEENLNRVFNRFRPFYHTRTGIRLGFKPRFLLDGSENLVLQEQELKEPTFESEDLIRAIEASYDGDAWAKSRPVRGFPFTLTVFEALFVRTCIIVKGDDCPYFSEPSWDSEQSKKLMTGISDRFVELSIENGIQPMIVFLRRSSTADYRNLLEELQTRYAQNQVDVIDAASDEIIAKTARATGGHFNRVGNMLVAEKIFQSMRNSTRELVSRPSH